MDAETLWELDRFVANYKKYLSKQKRKAERAMLARQNAELQSQHPVQQPQMVCIQSFILKNTLSL
jgi:flagellar biosynthesis protein FliP